MKLVSIVIPNYRKYPLSKHLKAVIRSAPGVEIIVVDDASPDNAADFIRANYPQVKLIVNKTNQRFAVSCNNGVKAAKGEIVVLINSDVAPKPGFLKPLIENFNDPQVFAVGCLEIQTVGGRKEISGKNSCQFKRGLVVHSKSPIRNLTHPSLNCWASGGSMAFDRKKYLQIGGMDPLYYPAYWEDIDLSWVAREKFGWKILFDPRSQVFHNHETTNISVFGQRQMELMALRNQLLFVWKNIRGRQLIEHFFWLPYHLIFTNFRTKGLFLSAFLQALIKWVRYKLCKH